MLDPKRLRDSLTSVADLLKTKGFKLDTATYQSLENSRKTAQILLDELRQERNRVSKSIGVAKSKAEPTELLFQSVAQLGDRLKAAEKNLDEIQAALDEIHVRIPNLPDSSVPVGPDETFNQVVRTVGEPQNFSFEARDHVALGDLKGINFDAAGQLSGSRFVVLQGSVARLHRALGQWMLDYHIRHHQYEEVWVPHLVNQNTAFGTGQWPQLAADLFVTQGDPGLILIPTSEMPVTNLAANRVFSEEELPVKWVCHSSCYRGEAGSYGKDTRGMLRQHQFEKVELVQISHPDNSMAVLEELTGHAEMILQKLQLPYRVMALSTGDLGFASAKTYDLEVWLPGQKTYREISSCSNMTDFQTRRMQARFKGEQGVNRLLHSLNGSALAVGRTLIAVLENYQDSDGRVAIPDVLSPYMDGQPHIF